MLTSEAGSLLALEKRDVSVTPWVHNIFRDETKLVVCQSKTVIKVKLSELGLLDATTLQEIRITVKRHGLDWFSNGEALWLITAIRRLAPLNWQRVLVGPSALVDADGIPHLPKLGFALGRFRVDTYYAWESSIFHPHNEFIVKKRYDSV